MRTKRNGNIHNKRKKMSYRIKYLGGGLTFAEIKANDLRVKEIRKIKEIFAESIQKVVIKTIDVNPLQLRLDQCFAKPDTTTSRLDQYIQAITMAIPSFSGSTPKKEWIDCPGICQDTIKTLIALEINSTSYMLRMLSESIISVDPQAKYTFEFSVLPLNVGRLTGIWKRDKDLVQLNFYEEYHDTNGNKIVKDPRLIMGFGPSASGKTYCAKKIIELLSTQDHLFPKTFLSIDGGIQRECSVVYQLAKTIAIQKGHAGLKNLVSSINSKSLFDSAIIKKNVKEYLMDQKALDAPDRPRKISLYVPETLGICGAVNCRGKYKSYIEITGDKRNWIALVIWQHKTADKCDFDDFHKCKGCTESGTTREMSEGKKYSSSAYPFSMYNGILESKGAPGGYFKIHNSGGQFVKVEQASTYAELEKRANSSSFTLPGLNSEKHKKTPLLNKNGDTVLCHTTIQDYSPLGKGLNEESRLKLTDFHWRYIKMTTEERLEKPADPLVPLEEEDEEDEDEIKEENPVHLGINNSKKLSIKPFRRPAGRFSPLRQLLPEVKHGGKRSTKRRTQRKRK